KEEVDENGEEIMEGALIARDKVGVQDFVLLDSHTSEAAFLNNLRKRYQENLIYVSVPETYIGSLLVSVNPYQELDLYTVSQMQLYRGVNFFELPPHLYAIADNAYRVMCNEFNNHFILISGESGAGKTEASKKILQYYAVTCPTTEQLQTVRDRLLLSNPVLEAFGNAKTLRNDNSSRFGKYMDIQFDFKGAPVGGHILSYLIEKSRVVHQNHGERNFHIFYQLLEGGDKELLGWLGLERNPQKYAYLIQGRCAKVFSINDKNDWKIVRKAFSIIDFTEKDMEVLLQLFGIVASVLHLGNIQFEEDSNGHAIIRDGSQIKWISKLLGAHLSILQEALTNRKIEARSEEVLSPLNVDLAFYARDAVAKAIYGRTFTWLVNKINGSLANKDSTQKTVIGLLDIYGFEVLDTNSFEQFCINYCNEKLQQLLIEMTLKAEQEEYELEGIEWEPIPYFNNKIICDLVEQKHKGIISILDEECLRPGEATDLSFLEKLEEKVGDHAHFVTRKLADQKTRKSIDWVDFRLLHYAGEVTYCAVGFLEKNNDLLYRNLKEVLCNSKNSIIRECFLLSELDNRRRPETVSSVFSLNSEYQPSSPGLGLIPDPKNSRLPSAFASRLFSQGILCIWPGALKLERKQRHQWHLQGQGEESDLNPKVLQLIRGENIKYVTPVVKYDRNGFKARERLLVLTQSSAYVVEMAKIKQKIEYSTLKGISTSNLSDGIVVIHVPEDKKGDVILQCEHLFETVTKLCILANKQSVVKVVKGRPGLGPSCASSLRFRVGSGKEGTMVFTVGPEPQVFKDKTGQLTVVRTQLGPGRHLVLPPLDLHLQRAQPLLPGRAGGTETPPKAGGDHPVSVTCRR
ncbi:hypothetical protein EK904_009208, partial [Melospiza melodia maxima]